MCSLWSNYFLLFFCWHKLKIQLQERNQNTTNTGEPTQPEWKSRNNAHMRSNLPMTINLLGVILRPLTLPNRVEFVKNILVDHVQGLFRIPKSPFPLHPTVIMQCVPNDLMCFLNKFWSNYQMKVSSYSIQPIMTMHNRTKIFKFTINKMLNILIAIWIWSFCACCKKFAHWQKNNCLDTLSYHFFNKVWVLIPNITVWT